MEDANEYAIDNARHILMEAIQDMGYELTMTVDTAFEDIDAVVANLLLEAAKEINSK